jgi:hypothetical protein
MQVSNSRNTVITPEKLELAFSLVCSSQTRMSVNLLHVHCCIFERYIDKNVLYLLFWWLAYIYFFSQSLCLNISLCLHLNQSNKSCLSYYVISSAFVQLDLFKMLSSCLQKQLKFCFSFREGWGLIHLIHPWFPQSIQSCATASSSSLPNSQIMTMFS